MREQEGLSANPRRSEGCLRAGMTAADHDHIEFAGEMHEGAE
jgi:hypothetical protein